jgi:spore coat polysaccharide biosynthesis predicted glycosyltransferase SpsG
MNAVASVVFRVDESNQIGFGHMFRCRVLAKALLSAGADVTFCSRYIRKNTHSALQDDGIEVVLLEDENVFFKRNFNSITVIVDGYQFGEDFWLRLRRARPKYTVFIDDFRNVRYEADLVICYNEGLREDQFRLRPGTRLMLGGRYMLLRPEFRKHRENCISAARHAVMLAAGGGCQDDWIRRTLEQIVRIETQNPVWVLSGTSLPDGKVSSWAETRSGQVSFFSELSPRQMMRLYSEALYLVVPASTMLLEAFCAGCPVITGFVAENQRNSIAHYEQRGLVVNAGDLRCLTTNTLERKRGEVLLHSKKMIKSQIEYIKSTEVGLKELVYAILSDCNDSALIG